MSLAGASLAGVKVKELKFSIDSDGKVTVGGDFNIETTTGLKIAKQSFGDGYNPDLKYSETPDVAQMRQQLFAKVASDINKLLGLG